MCSIGTVNIAELRDMLELLGQKVTESELKKMMGEVDVDGKGTTFRAQLPDNLDREARSVCVCVCVCVCWGGGGAG